MMMLPNIKIHSSHHSIEEKVDFYMIYLLDINYRGMIVYSIILICLKIEVKLHFKREIILEFEPVINDHREVQNISKK